MTDREYLASLQLPDVGPPEVLEVTTDGDKVTTRVRYHYTGSLDSLARQVLRGSDIVWTQQVVLDLATHRATFSVTPKVHPDRFSCGGTYVLREDGDGSVRRIDGELRIKVPLVASRAERMIVPGLVRRMDLEAEFLANWISEHNG